MRTATFVATLLASICLAATLAYADTVYEVQPGDILGAIAERHGVSMQDLIRWNPGLDPDRIRVGQRITIRGGTTPRTGGAAAATGSPDTYVVQSGDTMMGIAGRLGVGYQDLMAANPNVDANRIFVGQRLRVPATRAGAAASGNVYVVRPGDTLSAIAARHGADLADVLSWNRGLDADRIRVGQEIQIRSARPTREVVHRVQSGEVLGRIAERYDVTVSELVSWNRGLNPDRIRIGQEIRIIQEGPETPSESHGAAHDGRLVNGEQLPDHPGYTVRSRRRAWGTNETISALMAGFDHVRRVHPRAPRLAVHDLSYENGGYMPPHRSHQSGRDADIGYYHSGCTRTDCEYRAVRASELTPDLQWTLFQYWIDNGLVDYIFVDYTLQEVLHEHARQAGVSQRRLEQLFQYPRGRHSSRGIIRHEPGHRTHFHVRFSCGSRDSRCR